MSDYIDAEESVRRFLAAMAAGPPRRVYGNPQSSQRHNVESELHEDSDGAATECGRNSVILPSNNTIGFENPGFGGAVSMDNNNIDSNENHSQLLVEPRTISVPGSTDSTSTFVGDEPEEIARHMSPQHIDRIHFNMLETHLQNLNQGLTFSTAIIPEVSSPKEPVSLSSIEGSLHDGDGAEVTLGKTSPEMSSPHRRGVRPPPPTPQTAPRRDDTVTSFDEEDLGNNEDGEGFLMRSGARQTLEHSIHAPRDSHGNVTAFHGHFVGSNHVASRYITARGAMRGSHPTPLTAVIEDSGVIDETAMRFADPSDFLAAMNARFPNLYSTQVALSPSTLGSVPNKENVKPTNGQSKGVQAENQSTSQGHAQAPLKGCVATPDISRSLQQDNSISSPAPKNLAQNNEQTMKQPGVPSGQSPRLWQPKVDAAEQKLAEAKQKVEVFYARKTQQLVEHYNNVIQQQKDEFNHVKHQIEQQLLEEHKLDLLAQAAEHGKEMVQHQEKLMQEHKKAEDELALRLNQQLLTEQMKNKVLSDKQLEEAIENTARPLQWQIKQLQKTEQGLREQINVLEQQVQKHQKIKAEQDSQRTLSDEFAQELKQKILGDIRLEISQLANKGNEELLTKKAVVTESKGLGQNVKPLVKSTKLSPSIEFITPTKPHGASTVSNDPSSTKDNVPRFSPMTFTPITQRALTHPNTTATTTPLVSTAMKNVLGIGNAQENHGDREHLTHFKTWGSVSHGDRANRPIARKRKVLLTGLPAKVTPKEIASLLFKGTIESFAIIRATDLTANAEAYFVSPDDSIAYYNATPNGIPVKGLDNKIYNILVDLHNEPTPIGSQLQEHLDKGATRIVRAIGVEKDWLEPKLWSLAEGEKKVVRKVEGIIDGTSSSGFRMVTFRFMNIGDAVQFAGILNRHEDTEGWGVNFGVDPCAIATGVHLD